VDDRFGMFGVLRREKATCDGKDRNTRFSRSRDVDDRNVRDGKSRVCGCRKSIVESSRNLDGKERNDDTKVTKKAIVSQIDRW